jgi:RimJ/RimL family protein N-acetyltransferase
MEIRRITQADFDTVMKIYAYARQFMADHGNPNQWGPTGWPTAERIQQDIEEGTGFCVVHEGRVVGHFAFVWGPDPTYLNIEDGEWLDDSQYGVCHRMAGDGSVKGIAKAMLDWAYEKSGGHLRIDTHGDNVVMQNLMKKEGFIHTGTIYVEEDDFPRLAYEKSKEAYRRAGYVCGIS